MAGAGVAGGEGARGGGAPDRGEFTLLSAEGVAQFVKTLWDDFGEKTDVYAQVWSEISYLQ